MIQNRWAILMSGRGSTAQTVISESSARFHVVSVVSSRGDRAGIYRAKRSGFYDKTKVWTDWSIEGWGHLSQHFESLKVTGLLLLGFMRIVPPPVVEKFRGQIWNIHPSLLPDFPGANALEKSFFTPQAKLGVTVHAVDEGMDTGQPWSQVEVCRVGDFSLQRSLFSLAEARQLKKFVAVHSTVKMQITEKKEGR